MAKKSTKKCLCDGGCNHCEAVENETVAMLLNVLALRFGEEVWHITNSICPNLTCCPICRIDDFCHDCQDAKNGIAAIDEIGDDHESCEVANAAIRFLSKWEKTNKEAKQ